MPLSRQTLERSSVIPLYYQLQEILIEQIDSGMLKPNDPIPSENELCRMYGVSKNTVLQAIQSLVNKRLVYRVRGKGTFVADSKIRQSITSFLGYSSEIVNLKRTPSTKLMLSKEIEASPALANQLGVPKGSVVYHIQRLREVDATPMALQTSFLPKDLCPGLLDAPLEEDSLFKTLKDRFRIEITSATETLQAGHSPWEDIGPPEGGS